MEHSGPAAGRINSFFIASLCFFLLHPSFLFILSSDVTSFLRSAPSFCHDFLPLLWLLRIVLAVLDTVSILTAKLREGQMYIQLIG